MNPVIYRPTSHTKNVQRSSYPQIVSREILYNCLCSTTAFALQTLHFSGFYSSISPKGKNRSLIRLLYGACLSRRLDSIKMQFISHTQAIALSSEKFKLRQRNQNIRNLSGCLHIKNRLSIKWQVLVSASFPENLRNATVFFLKILDSFSLKISANEPFFFTENPH